MDVLCSCFVVVLADIEEFDVVLEGLVCISSGSSPVRRDSEYVDEEVVMRL